MKSSLTEVYNDVVAFERKVRLVVGTELRAHISPAALKDIADRAEKLLSSEEGSDAIPHLQLVEDVFKAAKGTYPIQDLNILWPADKLTKAKITTLKKQGCPSLALIAEAALKRRQAVPGPAKKL